LTGAPWIETCPRLVHGVTVRDGQIGVHGVIIDFQDPFLGPGVSHSATYLPSVCAEQGALLASWHAPRLHLAGRAESKRVKWRVRRMDAGRLGTAGHPRPLCAQASHSLATRAARLQFRLSSTACSARVSADGIPHGTSPSPAYLDHVYMRKVCCWMHRIKATSALSMPIVRSVSSSM